MYNTVNDSIIDLINKIKKDYDEKGMQDPNKMFKSFGKNSTWAFKVSGYIEKIKRIK